MRATRPLPALGSAVLASLALLLPAPARAASHQVSVIDFTFSPATLTIQVGDTVTFTNNGASVHNVRADNGSFRCANGCDDAGGNGTPSGSAWSFTRTFPQAGTVRYHCQVHGGPNGAGMSGMIVVQGDGGNDEPGTLRFSAATSSVGEGAGSATITVQRVGGDDGPATVQYATANGSATAGSDYTARSGALSWDDSDDSAKTFTVPILNDTAAEPTETVQLALSGATGASLGSPATAVLSITDNDGSTPGGAPAAPTNLRATAESTSMILLQWNDNASNETEVRIERRTLTGTFEQVATAPANATQATVPGLAPATGYVFRVRAANASGASAYSNEVQEATLADAGPCVEGPTTLCLTGGRFRVHVDWRSPNDQNAGNAVPLPTAPSSGLFYFFNAGNIELLVKVLNACDAPFNRYWVFFAATTTVEFTLTVSDTASRRTRVYFNPLNQAAAPIQDTDAFATCP